MAEDLNETPNNEIIKRALSLEMNSAVDKVRKGALDNPVSDGFVDPKTSINCWNEEKDK